MFQLGLECLQPLLDVHGHARRLANAGEAEDFLSDSLSARDGIGNAWSSQFHGWIGAGAAREEIDEGLNAHQHVIELVSDRGSQTAEAGNALRLEEPVFEAQSLALVHHARQIESVERCGDDGESGRPAVSVAQRRNRQKSQTLIVADVPRTRPHPFGMYRFEQW